MYLERNVTAFHVADVNTRQYLKIYELFKYYIRHTATEPIKQSMHVQCMSLSVSPVLHKSDTQLLLKKTIQSIHANLTVSVSPVLYQSDTQLLLRQSVNQYMYVTVS